MNIEELVKAWDKAQEDKCERFTSNIEQMMTYMTTIDPEAFGKLVSGLKGLDYYFERGFEDSKVLCDCILYMIITFQRNRETIYKIIDCPEIDVKFI